MCRVFPPQTQVSPHGPCPCCSPSTPLNMRGECVPFRPPSLDLESGERVCELFMPLPEMCLLAGLLMPFLQLKQQPLIAPGAFWPRDWTSKTIHEHFVWSYSKEISSALFWYFTVVAGGLGDLALFHSSFAWLWQVLSLFCACLCPHTPLLK